MKHKHILVVALVALAAALTFVGQAAARHLSTGTVISGTSGPPAASYYTAAALKAQGLRMQAMARTYSEHGGATARVDTSSSAFDVRDALVGAAGGLGIAIGAGGLLLAVRRSRRPQVAL